MPIQAMGLHIPCHYLTILSMYHSISIEVFAACILHYIAYNMYRTYNLKPKLSKPKSKLFFRYYLSSWITIMLVVLLLMICHDLISSDGTYTLPNDDCDLTARLIFNFSMICNTTIKTVQIIAFVVYLYYSCKLREDIRIHDVGRLSKLKSQQRQLNTISIAMGATIGISQLIFWLFIIFDLPATILGISLILFFIQQCVIMTRLICNKKVKGLRKKYFSKE